MTTRNRKIELSIPETAWKALVAEIIKAAPKQRRVVEKARSKEIAQLHAQVEKLDIKMKEQASELLALQRATDRVVADKRTLLKDLEALGIWANSDGTVYIDLRKIKVDAALLPKSFIALPLQ